MSLSGEGSFEKTIYEQLVGERGIGAGDTTKEFYPYPKNMRTLEVGFGEGKLIRELLKHNNTVYGIDVGKASLIGAEKDGFIDKANLIWMDASMNRFPYMENFFDFAFFLEAIEHTENPCHIFQQLKRVLKPGAKLMVAFPRPEDNLGFDSGRHAHVYPGFLMKHSFRMFCDQMYFKVLKYRENGSSAWYLLENIKTGKEVGHHVVISGNYSKEGLYSHLHTKDAWDDENDPDYFYKLQAENLLKGIKLEEKIIPIN